MKNNLNKAISHLESLGINVDAFYSIAVNVGGTTFQGDFHHNLIKILNENDWIHCLSKNGSLSFEHYVDDQQIRVVFY